MIPVWGWPKTFFYISLFLLWCTRFSYLWALIAPYMKNTNKQAYCLYPFIMEEKNIFFLFEPENWWNLKKIYTIYTSKPSSKNKWHNENFKGTFSLLHKHLWSEISFCHSFFCVSQEAFALYTHLCFSSNVVLDLLVLVFTFSQQMHRLPRFRDRFHTLSIVWYFLWIFYRISNEVLY
jgi:hypothetical protein